ncbi:glycoside hydrolase family 88 protein [Paenibacillus aurantiacus]|uniref:Glycoside hydrolase family 88 protein n=1 Tax=Paenibacillus aurantiacus TaxID=1936118 RepID=A0ABV5KLD8_9BACL
MWQDAIAAAMETVRANIVSHPGRFPHITEGRKYEWGGNDDWIEGFYTGLAWLSYEYSGDEWFKAAAEAQLESYAHRLKHHIVLDHHDIGFLYSPSAIAQWRITGHEGARELALAAADKLADRYRPAYGAIQAWGKEGDPANGGRIIIDCLLNLPLLYWAHEQTGEQRYYDIATKHAQKSLRFLVRGDGSSYHTFYFDQGSGAALHGGTHQGYQDGSTWTRGQAWGIYGFALSYRYTKDPAYLDASKRLALYYIEHLPEDHVAYWDFDVEITEGTPRDSSASAIAACGLLELLEQLPLTDADRNYFSGALSDMMGSLAETYSTRSIRGAEGLLQHGSYHVRGERAPDDYMIWGDYFYLEALVRMSRGIKGYW